MAQETGHSTDLKKGVIGVIPLAFLVLAAAAPLGACASNIPLIMGTGNGAAAPLDFVIIGVLLILFSVGFAAMSSHVTNSGAFYTYISMGLGKRLGGAMGYVAVIAYNVLSVYCAACSGYFASSIFETEFGIAIPWYVFSVVLYIIIFLFGYFGIEGGTKFLMVCLACEVCIVLVTDFAVLFTDGPSAYPLDSFSPTAFFSGAPGMGVAFAFLCFIGFEATAIFGEEAKDPRHTVPRATYIAVILISVVYAFTAWSIVAGVGVDRAVAMFNEGNAAQIIYSMSVAYVHPVFGHIFNLFLFISSFACWLAVHNMCSRYLFAFSRAGMMPAVMARTHPKYKSPYIAGVVQLVFSLAVILICLAAGLDPYAQTGAICSAVAIVGVLTLEILVSIAVIRFLRAHNAEEGYHYSVFTTTIAPIISAIGLVYVTFLLVTNFGSLTGVPNDAVNVFLACLMWIIGVIGYVVSAVKDKNGTLADPASIDADGEIA